jgi:hypothetical protein
MRNKSTLAYHVRYFHILSAAPPPKLSQHALDQLQPQPKPYSAKRRAMLGAAADVTGMAGERAMKRMDGMIGEAKDKRAKRGKTKRPRATVDRVAMVHRETGRIVSGTAAPARKVRGDCMCGYWMVTIASMWRWRAA